MTRKTKTHHIAVAAVLTAIAFILQFAEFSVPFLIPDFVKLDLSDLPALLGTFALGPTYGIAIELVKNVLHLPFGTSAGVGELCNFLLGGIFVSIAGIIYKHKKNRSSAIWGSMVGAVAMAILSLPLNYFLVYPTYAKFYPIEIIISLYEVLLGNIAYVPTGNALFNCLLVFNLPFTLAKGLINVLICYFIYKPLSPVLHK